MDLARTSSKVKWLCREERITFGATPAGRHGLVRLALHSIDPLPSHGADLLHFQGMVYILLPAKPIVIGGRILGDKSIH